MSDLETIERLAKVVEKKRGELKTAEDELSQAVDAHRAKLADVLKSVRPQGALGGPRAKRGERQEKVRALHAQGKSPEEIAKETGYYLSVVKEAIASMEKKEQESLLDDAARRSEGGASGITGTAPNGEPGGGDDDDDDEREIPPSQAKIVALVKRIKNRKGVARLTMAVKDGHSHIAEVNEKGHGYTSPGRNGHTHRVVAFTCGQGPDGHRHDVNAEAAD